MTELKLERQISPLPPVVLGGLLVVPIGLVSAITGRPVPTAAESVDNQAVAAKARAIVMAIRGSLVLSPWTVNSTS